MPTDLRAALREAADAHPDDEKLRALADSPPTVAELLPLVDETHAVEWVNGSQTIRAVLSTAGMLVLESDGKWWLGVRPSDLAQPATLVEVPRGR